ncbi:MAG: hypothetical protein ACYDHG_05840 [Desulfomonilaceae bacterium]
MIISFSPIPLTAVFLLSLDNLEEKRSDGLGQLRAAFRRNLLVHAAAFGSGRELGVNFIRGFPVKALMISLTIGGLKIGVELMLGKGECSLHRLKYDDSFWNA